MVDDIAEVPSPRRRRQWSFYFILLFFVGPIWAVVPLSWLFVVPASYILVVYSMPHSPVMSFASVWTWVFLYALLEVLFSVYCYLLTRRVSKPLNAAPADLEVLQNAYKRMLQSGLTPRRGNAEGGEDLLYERPASPAETIEHLEFDDLRAIDFRNRMRTWFRRVPWSHIRLRHIHAWLYWSMFNAPLPEQIPEAHRNAIDDAVELLEKRTGCQIPSGPGPDVEPILLTLDPINIAARSILWYLFIQVANKCLRTYYRTFHGVKYGRFRDLEYLIYVPRGYSRQKGPDPLILLHGLGLGIFQYQQALSHFLAELPNTPFIVPIIPQISSDIFHPRYLRPLLREEKADGLIGLLEELGWVGVADSGETFGVTVLSHSNGSYAHAWMLKSNPEFIKRSCFVDPVTFCLWEGDVCYNFIYRKCVTGFELVIRYVVGMELGVANLLQRHFDWTSNVLWFEEIPNALDPRKTFFVMGGKDCVVNSERVKLYLTNHGVKEGLWFDPDGQHAVPMVLPGKGMRAILEWLKDEPKEALNIMDSGDDLCTIPSGDLLSLPADAP